MEVSHPHVSPIPPEGNTVVSAGRSVATPWQWVGRARRAGGDEGLARRPGGGASHPRGGRNLFEVGSAFLDEQAPAEGRTRYIGGGTTPVLLKLDFARSDVFEDLVDHGGAAGSPLDFVSLLQR